MTQSKVWFLLPAPRGRWESWSDKPAGNTARPMWNQETASTPRDDSEMTPAFSDCPLPSAPHNSHSFHGSRKPERHTNTEHWPQKPEPGVAGQTNSSGHSPQCSCFPTSWNITFYTECHWVAIKIMGKASAFLWVGGWSESALLGKAMSFFFLFLIPCKLK